MKLLIGGSPCTHWSIAQTKHRETEPSGLGRKWSWESLIDAYEEEKALDAAQISLFDFVETTGGCICGAPCGCYDG